MTAYCKADAFCQDRHQHYQPIMIYAISCATWISEVTGCYEGLYLYEQRPCTFHTDSHCRSAGVDRAIREENC